MEKSETNIFMYDNKIKVKEQKQYFFTGLGFLLILFSLVSFSYKNGTHGISDIFTYTTLIIGIILIIIDLKIKN